MIQLIRSIVLSFIMKLIDRGAFCVSGQRECRSGTTTGGYDPISSCQSTPAAPDHRAVLDRRGAHADRCGTAQTPAADFVPARGVRKTCAFAARRDRRGNA